MISLLTMLPCLYRQSKHEVPFIPQQARVEPPDHDDHGHDDDPDNQGKINKNAQQADQHLQIKQSRGGPENLERAYKPVDQSENEQGSQGRNKRAVALNSYFNSLPNI